jgi:hypothetical protein
MKIIMDRLNSIATQEAAAASQKVEYTMWFKKVEYTMWFNWMMQVIAEREDKLRTEGVFVSDGEKPYEDNLQALRSGTDSDSDSSL